MKKIILSLAMFMLSYGLFAQMEAKNNVFIEAFGVTGRYSVNYERLFMNKEALNLAMRAGISYISGNIYTSNYLYPVSVSLIKQLRKSHYFEFRLFGSNQFYKDEDYSNCGPGGPCDPETITVHNFYPGLGMGYRYQPALGGLYFSGMVQKRFIKDETTWRDFVSLGMGYAF
ncbi:MAG: hypothetical protein K9I29_03450 [Bacteroidales bacterium]|nr:hypothetical protein [Bacteroidales bacterium]MCF8327327.1 hypothetical protein [Bacteroidales bacterium]